MIMQGNAGLAARSGHSRFAVIRKLPLVVLVLLAVWSSAALAEGIGASPAGKARIVVYRPATALGALARGWPVKVDGQSMGDIKPGTYGVVDRSPGRHQFTLDLLDIPGKTHQDFSVGAGRVYVFEARMKPKAETALRVGAVAGVIGWAIAANSYAANDKSGMFEFIPLGEGAGRKATSGMKQASPVN